MKNSGIYLFGDNVDFKHKIDLIKKYGFNSTAIFYSDEYSSISKESRLNIINEANINIEYMHLPFKYVNSLWGKSKFRKSYYNEIFNAIKICKNNNIQYAVMHITNGIKNYKLSKKAFNRFKKIVKFAKKNNVTIAFENTRKIKEFEFIVDNLLNNKYLEKFVAVCYDSGHNNCFTPNYDFLDKYKKYIKVVHLQDNNGKTDEHLLPFEGKINFKNIIITLKEVEFDSDIHLEINSEAVSTLEELERFLEKARNVVIKLKSLI
jgi:sugar phosphate isomerase/epimerase